MKNFLTLAAILLYPAIFLSQNCTNWTPDIILENQTVSDVEYNSQNIIIRDNVIFESSVKFENCNVKVANSIEFNEGAEFDINGSTFCPENGVFWFGFRGEHHFNPILVSLKVSNSYFYDTDEFLHIAFKPGSKFILTDNYITADPAAGTHICHLVDFNMTDEFAFHGNTLISESNVCLALWGSDDPLANHWKIGDNTKNRNYFISTPPSGNFIHATNVAVNVHNKDYIADFENTTFQGASTAFHNRGNNNFFNFDNCEFSNSGMGYLKVFGSGTSNFDNCHFINNQLGIHNSEEENFLINNSTFQSNHTGIKNSLTSQSNGRVQVLNSEFDNAIDIHSTGAFFDRMLLLRNTFEGNQFGVLTDGESNYLLSHNDFNNSYLGTFHFNNGDEDNLIEENNIGGIIGIHTQGENNDFKFLDNCFLAEAEDLNSLGTIASYLGDQVVGAGNCFTSGLTIDINHEGPTFGYYLPSDEEGSCHEPMFDSDYEIQGSDRLRDKFCGTGNDIIANERCFVPLNPTCAEVLAAITYVNQEIANITNDETLTESIKNVLLAKLLRCKRYLTIQKMRKCVVTTEPFPVDEGGFRLQSKYYAYLLSQSQYPQAQYFLDSVSYEGEEAIDYIAVQRINLRRLVDGENFEIAPGELDLIRDAGNKSYPLAAYARGLLAVLTGEIIYPVVELANSTEPRSIERKNIIRPYVFPNPAREYLHIQDADDYAKYSVYNTNGSLLQSGDLRSKKIDISDLDQGMYLLQLNSQSEDTYLHKFIKI